MIVSNCAVADVCTLWFECAYYLVGVQPPKAKMGLVVTRTSKNGGMRGWGVPNAMAYVEFGRNCGTAVADRVFVGKLS